MITKELIEKARKCTSREELLALARAEGVEISEEQLESFLASPEKAELSDAELENTTGGTCYSSCTYEELGVTPYLFGGIRYDHHPVIVTDYNTCRLSSSTVCWFCTEGQVVIEGTRYCLARSEEYDPVDDPQVMDKKFHSLI